MRFGRYTLSAATMCLLAGCEGNRDRLLADLQSARAEDRATSLRKVALMGRAEDLVIFTRAAKDPVAIVRSESAEALGRSQDPRVVDLLSELLGDPDDGVQAKAAAALGAIGSEKAKAYLLAQYGRRGQSTRWAIVQALHSANVPGAMAAAVAAEATAIWNRNLRALSEGSLAERVSAAEELGKSGRQEAVSRLLELIQEPQVVLVAAAARGLGHAGDTRVAPIIARLLEENHPDLRQATCEALLQLRDPRELPKLKEVATEKSSASPMAIAAIAALPRTSETDAALCGVVLWGSDEGARAAGREMRGRGGCPLKPLLEAFPRVAKAGRERLKKRPRPDRQPVPTLSSALRAVEVLGATARNALPALLPYLGDRNRELRRLAVDAAAATRDPSAAGEIRKVYDEEVRRLSHLRARWINRELPKQYASGFDPSEEKAPTDSDSPERSKRVELLRRVRERNSSEGERSAPSPELADDVSEDDLRLLASALRGLGQVRAAGASELLRAHLADASPSIRAAASKGLADLEKPVPADAETEREVQSAGSNSKEPLPGLLKALEDSSGMARREVLLALGRTGDSRAAEAIARDLLSDSAESRAAAAEALTIAGGAPQLEALDALKADYYRRVRDNAAAAIAKINAASEGQR